MYYASLAGSYVGRIDVDTGAATVLDRPPPQGTRRVWSDSRGRIWASQWDAGQVAVYDPRIERVAGVAAAWQPPQAYAVYVDERDTCGSVTSAPTH